ncbi:hypothetical protein BpHYR1_008200 [Brachionus plicatilis]|uniref:Uncharacterized protein n=1 Tax=Brachionus plicatilis TaxID=10195 RepID=A0A3M7RVF8_BRAPC|nr:hypothetical protein BpHYR1_008200 [Brachionus plicatilis]
MFDVFHALGTYLIRYILYACSRLLNMLVTRPLLNNFRLNSNLFYYFLTGLYGTLNYINSFHIFLNNYTSTLLVHHIYNRFFAAQI